jgi:hypothetical protein
MSAEGKAVQWGQNPELVSRGPRKEFIEVVQESVCAAETEIDDSRERKPIQRREKGWTPTRNQNQCKPGATSSPISGEIQESID